MEKIFLDFLSVAFWPVVPSLESFIGLLTGAEEQKEERAVNFYSSQINASNTSLLCQLCMKEHSLRSCVT